MKFKNVIVSGVCGLVMVGVTIGLPILKSVTTSGQQRIKDGVMRNIDDDSVIKLSSDGAATEAQKVEEQEAAIRKAESTVKEHADHRQKVEAELKDVKGTSTFIRSALNTASGTQSVIIGNRVFEPGTVLHEIESLGARHEALTNQLTIEDEFFKDVSPKNGVPDVVDGIQSARAVLQAAKAELAKADAARDRREGLLQANRSREKVADLVSIVKPGSASKSPMVAADAELDRRIEQSGREADRKLAGAGPLLMQPSPVAIAAKEAIAASSTVAGK